MPARMKPSPDSSVWSCVQPWTSVVGLREVHPAEQLRQEGALDAGLCDERGDHRLAHAALHGQRGLGGCLVQFGNLIGRFARLEEQFEPVWLVSSSNSPVIFFQSALPCACKPAGVRMFLLN
jgi:hypothetical protein